MGNITREPTFESGSVYFEVGGEEHVHHSVKNIVLSEIGVGYSRDGSHVWVPMSRIIRVEGNN